MSSYFFASHAANFTQPVNFFIVRIVFSWEKAPIK